MHTVTTLVPPLQLSSWAAPPWTSTITVDGDLIVCSHTLGSIPETPNCAGDTLPVIIVQRDEIRPDRDLIHVVRHPPEILIGGVSLNSTQARGLSRLVNDAITLITNSG